MRHVSSRSAPTPSLGRCAARLLAPSQPQTIWPPQSSLMVRAQGAPSNGWPKLLLARRHCASGSSATMPRCPLRIPRGRVQSTSGVECQRWAGETTRQTQFQKNQGHHAEAEEAPCNARRVAGASCYVLSCRAEYAPGRVRRRPLSILVCPRVLFSLTMLVRDDLPELGTDLVAALPSLDVNDLAHCFCRGAKQSVPVSKFATQPSHHPPLLGFLSGFSNGFRTQIPRACSRIVSSRIFRLKIAAVIAGVGGTRAPSCAGHKPRFEESIMMMRFTPRCWLSCLALVATVEGFALLSAPPLPAAARAPGSCHSSWSCAAKALRRSPRCSVVQTRAGFLDSLFGNDSSSSECNLPSRRITLPVCAHHITSPPPGAAQQPTRALQFKTRWLLPRAAVQRRSGRSSSTLHQVIPTTGTSSPARHHGMLLSPRPRQRHLQSHCNHRPHLLPRLGERTVLSLSLPSPH